MKTTIFIIAIATAALATVVAVGVTRYTQPATKSVDVLSTITDFSTCADAGNPVEESFPRQCRTKDNKVFIENITVSEQGCRSDIGCGKGKYCDQGICKEVVLDHSCTQNSDCQLINSFYGYSCCYAGQCDTIDYSQDNWIAVNTQSFTATKAKVCPTPDQCGPQPGCATGFKPTNFEAQCLNQLCVKGEKATAVPKKNPAMVPNQPTATCKNQCGDGVCQGQTDCYGPNCTCAETIQTCPKDCAQAGYTY